MIGDLINQKEVTQMQEKLFFDYTGKGNNFRHMTNLEMGSLVASLMRNKHIDSYTKQHIHARTYGFFNGFVCVPNYPERGIDRYYNITDQQHDAVIFDSPSEWRLAEDVRQLEKERIERMFRTA